MLKLRICELISDFCLWLIQKTNRYKDRNLATRLQNLAKKYDPE